MVRVGQKSASLAKSRGRLDVTWIRHQDILKYGVPLLEFLLFAKDQFCKFFTYLYPSIFGGFSLRTY